MRLTPGGSGAARASGQTGQRGGLALTALTDDQGNPLTDEGGQTLASADRLGAGTSGTASTPTISIRPGGQRG